MSSPAPHWVIGTVFATSLALGAGFLTGADLQALSTATVPLVLFTAAVNYYLWEVSGVAKKWAGEEP